MEEMKKLAERTLGEQKALVSQKWEEIKANWAENKSADDASKAKAEVDASEWSVGVQPLYLQNKIRLAQPTRNFSPPASLTQLACKVREARELLDEALRELRRSDGGEGGAGQSRADGKGVRRDARTAAGPSDAGDVHSHSEGLKGVFVPF